MVGKLGAQGLGARRGICRDLVNGGHGDSSFDQKDMVHKDIYNKYTIFFTNLQGFLKRKRQRGVFSVRAVRSLMQFFVYALRLRKYQIHAAPHSMMEMNVKTVPISDSIRRPSPSASCVMTVMGRMSAPYSMTETVSLRCR